MQEIFNAKLAELDTVSASVCIEKDAISFRGGERKRRCKSDAKLEELDTVSASACVKRDAIMFEGGEWKRRCKSACMPSWWNWILRVYVC